MGRKRPHDAAGDAELGAPRRRSARLAVEAGRDDATAAAQPTARPTVLLTASPSVPPTSLADAFLEVELALSRDLAALKLPPHVTHVYNPLEYALPTHRRYVERYCAHGVRALFLGMNPGPFGMVQTGVPFGDPSIVREWLGIEGPVGRPPRGEHPSRPVLGFACPRTEVSGTRLWGLFRSRWPSARDFFRDHFVHNYCPLVFMERSGKNVTPDQLPAATREALFTACDRALLSIVNLLQPRKIVGIGAFARARAEAVAKHAPHAPECAGILHPSPASPLANRDWEGTVVRQLAEIGVVLPAAVPR